MWNWSDELFTRQFFVVLWRRFSIFKKTHTKIGWWPESGFSQQFFDHILRIQRAINFIPTVSPQLESKKESWRSFKCWMFSFFFFFQGGLVPFYIFTMNFHPDLDNSDKNPDVITSTIHSNPIIRSILFYKTRGIPNKKWPTLCCAHNYPASLGLDKLPSFRYLSQQFSVTVYHKTYSFDKTVGIKSVQLHLSMCTITDCHLVLHKLSSFKYLSHHFTEIVS